MALLDPGPNRDSFSSALGSMASGVRHEILTKNRDLVEGLDHSVLVSSVDVGRAVALTQPEDRLDDGELGRCGIKTSDSHPVIDNHTRTNDSATAVHTTSYKRHLEQTRQLVLILNACLWVHDTTLIAQSHVASCEHIVRDGLPEHLHAQHIGYDLLCFAFYIRVYESDVIVATYYVAER